MSIELSRRPKDRATLSVIFLGFLFLLVYLGAILVWRPDELVETRPVFWFVVGFVLSALLHGIVARWRGERRAAKDNPGPTEPILAFRLMNRLSLLLLLFVLAVVAWDRWQALSPFLGDGLPELGWPARAYLGAVLAYWVLIAPNAGRLIRAAQRLPIYGGFGFSRDASTGDVVLEERRWRHDPNRSRRFIRVREDEIQELRVLRGLAESQRYYDLNFRFERDLLRRGLEERIDWVNGRTERPRVLIDPPSSMNMLLLWGESILLFVTLQPGSAELLEPLQTEP